jgi:Na+-transporting NADH:ubiquinone oxidoreductase subunit NqrC
MQSYPNWITHINIINEKFLTKYITSFYFLLTTMTTVGYGDIVCISSIERIFHIILLAIGTLIYTFLVSKIGNILRNQSHEQIKLDKDLNILESIRISNPKMPFKLYYKIKAHLINISKKRKKNGLSFLINGIPETLRNNLLYQIYSKEIKGFTVFKNVKNSSFVLQMLSSFIPLISKKEEILILEGEFIDNIIFVKDGRLVIEIVIDLNDPYKSIQKYLEYM